MALLDFLFNGSPPPSVTTNSTSTQQLPAYFADYQRAILNKANALAGMDYPAWSGQRFAGLNSWDTTAQQGVTDNAYNGVSNVQGALGNLGDAFGAYQAPNQQGQALTGQAANTAQGFADIGQNYANSVGTIGQAPTYAGLDNVGQSAQLFNQGDFNQFMNPYNEQVTNRIAQLGERNLQENLLPHVNDAFIGGGMFGSGRNADFTGRAVRDANESILGQQAQTLQSGFQNSMQNYQAGQGRQLAAGQAQGQLGNQLAGQQMNAGQLMGAVGSNLTGAQLQAGAQMGTLGNQATTQATGLANATGALGQLSQSMGLAGAAANQTQGDLLRGLNQQNLDFLYNQFQDQAYYPQKQTQFMNSILTGQQIPLTTNQTTTGPGSNFQPSPLAQLAGSLSGVAGISRLFG